MRLRVLLPYFRLLIPFARFRWSVLWQGSGMRVAALSACALGTMVIWTHPAVAEPNMSVFHWVDFHDSKDAPTVAWVTQALKAEHWTAIREIGVQWDSALVVTSERKTPPAATPADTGSGAGSGAGSGTPAAAPATPPADTYTVWAVSLSKHEVQPLLHGVNPRILNWTNFGGEYQQVPELALVYDDCYGCDAPSTFFTTLHYSFKDHAWRARWINGDQAAPLSTGGTVDGVTRTQVYGLLTEQPQRDVLATWSHMDYGKAKPAQDFVFEYSVDPLTGLEQTQGLSGDHAEAMMLRLCMADPGQVDPALAVLARGQESAVCQELVAAKTKTKPMRKPTTTPPANNHGQSSPPGAKK